MARTQTVTVELTDDLDGSRADETISFAFEGKTYEIDLSKRNAAALRKHLSPYIEGARKQVTRRSPRSRSIGATDPKVVRAWAVAHGVEVPARGRIPATVIDQYLTAK